jgi:hypothetical protein
MYSKHIYKIGGKAKYEKIKSNHSMAIDSCDDFGNDAGYCSGGYGAEQ